MENLINRLYHDANSNGLSNIQRILEHGHNNNSYLDARTIIMEYLNTLHGRIVNNTIFSNIFPDEISQQCRIVRATSLQRENAYENMDKQ